jgi:MATE family multidrug resistance protein
MAPATNLNHKIWQIAWPAIVSNISLPLLGLVDAAILGHLDSTVYLGAVAIGASILSFLYWGFGFLRMGTTGLIARAVGAQDKAGELTIILQSIVLALVLASLVVVTHPLWLSLGLWLMEPGPALAPLTHDYISIRVYSAPAVLVTYAVVGWFIGRQNTRWPMVFVVVTNLLNILLDLLFIVVLDMKSDGAALATLIAEYVGCLLAVMALLKSLDLRPLAEIRQQLVKWQAYGKLLDSNRYLFVRTMGLLFSFAFFTAMSTRLGQNTLAANTIMLQLLIMAAYALDGFAYAAEGLAGNATGAGNLQRFYQVVAACWRWSIVTAVGISCVLLLAGPMLYPLFTSHTEVQLLLQKYHLWLALMPLTAAWSYLLDGIFIGTAKSRYMMYSMLFSVLLVYLPAWYLLQAYANHGLWLAFILFNAARGATLQWCYQRLSRRSAWLAP